MGYTAFAKRIKKLMVDNDENLVDIAEVLNVSVSYVSLVFVGKKQASEEWVNKIANHYGLSSDEYNDLYNDYCDSRDSLKYDLSESNTLQKRLAINLQRNLNDLNREDIENILKIIKKGDE